MLILNCSCRPLPLYEIFDNKHEVIDLKMGCELTSCKYTSTELVDIIIDKISEISWKIPSEKIGIIIPSNPEVAVILVAAVFGLTGNLPNIYPDTDLSDIYRRAKSLRRDAVEL